MSYHSRLYPKEAVGMKVTRDNMENLRDRMQAVADAWGELEESIDTWLDEDTDREERADARETIDQELGTLLAALKDVPT